MDFAIAVEVESNEKTTAPKIPIFIPRILFFFIILLPDFY